MFRPVLILLTGVLTASTCFADDSPAEKSILKVYPVGDIVAASAMYGSTYGKTTAGEWAAQYPETTAALHELRGIVEAACSQRPMAVTVYSPSLSLIVRHTKDGHDEIGQLLETLAGGNDAVIQIKCRAMYSQSPAELANSKRTDSQNKELQKLLSKQKLTREETKELLTLTPRKSDDEESLTNDEMSVALKSGRRTAWGHAGRPCTAMGLVNRKTNLIDLRIDYIADDYSDSTPFGTQVFCLGDGESAFFHHYCDGGTVVWLVTATILGSDKPERVSQATTDAAKTFADRESAFEFIHAELSKRFNEQSGPPGSIQDLKENSRATSISVDNQSFFVVYADFKNPIRGQGGNGPVYVFQNLPHKYRLAYSNAFDEMVNNVAIQKDDSGYLVLHTLAHIGLSSGHQQPVEYRWDGARFVSVKKTKGT